MISWCKRAWCSDDHAFFQLASFDLFDIHSNIVARLEKQNEINDFSGDLYNAIALNNKTVPFPSK